MIIQVATGVAIGVFVAWLAIIVIGVIIEQTRKP